MVAPAQIPHPTCPFCCGRSCTCKFLRGLNVGMKSSNDVIKMFIRQHYTRRHARLLLEATPDMESGAVGSQEGSILLHVIFILSLGWLLYCSTGLSGMVVITG